MTVSVTCGGIIARLDYLETLGIDGIWLSPVCASPQVDNGYDISDCCAIDPMFGTMADMEELIAEGKKWGISIIFDLVLNHCSDQHPWFLEALKGPENPYSDYFIWRDGKEDTPPNSMRSVFGGPAWTWSPQRKQWYFHQLAPQQPDLNWENPRMRQDLYKSIRFWVDKGIEGFRLEQGYAPEDVMASIHARSRDNARTPMQWTQGENAGFTSGKPWVPVNPNFPQINAEAALADENSVFHHYRKLIEARKTYDVFRSGSFTLLLPEGENIFAYTRQTETEHLLVVCNFTDKYLQLDAPEAFRGAEVLLSNYAEEAEELRPYEAVMLYYKD